MSIRMRVVDGLLVALCAARSMPKDGDVYLDDGQHEALARKFRLDHPELGIPVESETRERMEREESNNPNRDAWERVYGGQK